MPARFPAGATAHCIVLLLLLVTAASAAAVSPASTISKTALLVRQCTSSCSSHHRSFPLAASFHCHTTSSSRRIARLAFSAPLLIRSQQKRRLNPFASAAASIMTAPASATVASAAANDGSGSGPVRAKVITDVRAAGQLLRIGNLVAFPTETVYGLGASVYDEAAVRRIFAVKGRPLTDPLIAHVARTEDAWAVFRCGAENDNDGGEEKEKEKEKEQRLLSLLAEKFWPGPLTLVAPAANAIPGAVTAGTGWIGVRCPAHPLARRLLEEAGVPVVAPSANRFGHVSPTSAAHVLADLGAHDIAVLDGDATTANREGKEEGEGCRIGIESTVAKVDAAGNTITILRAGAVTASQLLGCMASHGMTGIDVRVLQRRVSLHRGKGKGQEEEGQSVLEEAEGPQMSPGQSITHYAPDRPTFLLSSSQANGQEGWAQALVARAVVLDVGGRLRGVEAHAAHYRDLSPQGDMRQAAAGLFESLRWAEAVGEEGLMVLVVDLRGEEDALPSQEEREFAAALIDRILRAASGRPAGAYLLKEESG